MAKTFIACEDLTGKTSYVVVASADNKEVELAGANEVAFGILTNDGISGAAVGVAKVGETILGKLGGAVSFGDKLIADSDGKLVASDATGDDNIIAEAQEDGADEDLIYVTVVQFTK